MKTAWIVEIESAEKMVICKDYKTAQRYLIEQWYNTIVKEIMESTDNIITDKDINITPHDAGILKTSLETLLDDIRHIIYDNYIESFGYIYEAEVLE